MKSFEIGQVLWDEKNACEVTVLSFNGTDYHCKTITGACDDDAGEEGYQWFTAQELNSMKESTR